MNFFQRLIGRASKEPEKSHAAFVMGDEWALIELLPEENLAQCHEQIERSNAYRNNEPFPLTGSAKQPFILDKAALSIHARAITLQELTNTLHEFLPRLDQLKSCTDSSGAAYPLRNGFAFGSSNCFIYGTVTANSIDTLCFHKYISSEPEKTAMARALETLGKKYCLVLRVGADSVVELKNDGAAFSYL